MKAAKCAWSFVARQTGALGYTEVGGGAVDDDDVGGDGVEEYDDADDFDGFELEGNHLPSFATREKTNGKYSWIGLNQKSCPSVEKLKRLFKRDSRRRILKIHKLFTFFPYKGVGVSHTVR